jgi:hypothetical protein
VCNVVHKVPNTPWQMVSDIRRRPSKKQRQRAPTPHDLGHEMAEAVSDGEEEEEEETLQQEDEGAAERDAGQQPQQLWPAEGVGRQAAAGEGAAQGVQEPRRGQRRAAAERHTTAGRRQGSAATAPAAAAAAKPSTRSAAGSRRKGRR